MTQFAGRDITKNTMVGMSIGTLLTLVLIAWSASGVGRPLFAADLSRIESKIDAYQTTTAVQILQIRKAALRSEMRQAKRDVRSDPGDSDAVEDVDEIESDIEDINDRIACHRTEGCEVESEI